MFLSPRLYLALAERRRGRLVRLETALSLTPGSRRARATRRPRLVLELKIADARHELGLPLVPRCAHAGSGRLAVRA